MTGIGAVWYSRLASKRILARMFFCLPIIALLYSFYSSVELRRDLDDRLQHLTTAPRVETVEDLVVEKVTEEVVEKVIEEVVPDFQQCPNEIELQRNGTEKATLVMLVRNREIREALSSMRNVEDRFNKKFHYPWTFLNDKEFTPEFIEYTTGMASGPVEYAVIPKNCWSMPPSVNVTLAKHEMAAMAKQNIIYGGSLSYRHMCRFNSGFFYEMDIMQKYDWYWRVEPGIELYCDINYDPFTFMRTNNKVYGFVITMYEFQATIKTLWSRTKEFIRRNPQYLAANNSLDFLVDGARSSTEEDTEIDGEFNLCHFWSNFEIASLNFYRGEAYSSYFKYLDSTNGFYYERWGDAPVHTLGVGLFAPKDQVHHFADIGYSHPPASRCPQDDESHTSGRCFCDRKNNFDTNPYSCTPRWWDVSGLNKGAKRLEA